jgi:hypothetical protein
VSTAPVAVSEERSSEGVTRVRFHLFVLTFVFVLTLPLVNPLVHGDGVGYYAYLRAPIIQHNLRFEEDWRHANLGFAQWRLDSADQLRADQYTPTGHVDNLFSVGPAILWSPFFLAAHFAVLAADWLGADIPADGFSPPYRVLVAFGTAFYGLCALLLSYALARKYVDASWALLATIGIWLSSSLPVYMYFNPFWSHALSAFVLALFLWYWDRTRPERTLSQWLLLGLISGLAVDVYFLNGIFLLIPCLESLQDYLKDWRSKDRTAFFRLFGSNLAYLATFVFMLIPTFVTRKIIFGGILRFGSYTVLPWNWHAPYWFSVLFSSDHGFLTWTPLLGLALLGLLFPSSSAKWLKPYLILTVVGFFYVISSYPYWDGMSSFGNRFLISLTPIYVLGLAFLLERGSRLFASFRQAYATQGFALSLFALWNLAFIFQWGTHMLPVRGAISWSAMVHNQFVKVPSRVTHSLESYFLHRSEMMQHIEQEDIEQQKLGAHSEGTQGK